MGPPDARTQQPPHRRVATGVVAFLTLYQGAVPLVARGLFGAEQRFAPALWLPAPWWWVACLAVTAAGVAVLAALDGRRDAPAGEAAAAPPAPAEDEEDARTAGYVALEGFVFLAGLYNGVAPFVSRLVFDGDLLLALPLRLPSPWWWVASLAVIAATAALLVVLDRAERNRP
jgi:hypothetical protein